MRIDSAGFSVCLEYADGSRRILRDDCDLEFDYGGSHFKGRLKSVRKVLRTNKDTNFVLYIWGTMGNENKSRIYDIPLWQLENLEGGTSYQLL